MSGEKVDLKGHVFRSRWHGDGANGYVVNIDQCECGAVIKYERMNRKAKFVVTAEYDACPLAPKDGAQ